MWDPDYARRLVEWRGLRDRCQVAALDQCMLMINDWWWQAPMVNHYLHWDDHATWPTPWELLADNIFCDVARAAAMLYTVSMLERTDITDIELVRTKTYNLVQVNSGKYILNWCPGDIVNIQSVSETPSRRISSTAFQHLLG
jgi:hypothetical protein